jgi:hypothetical protein
MGQAGELESEQATGVLRAWDAELLEHLSSTEAGGPSPKSVALLELRQDLQRLRCEYVVIGGDWNMGPPGVTDYKTGEETTSNRRNTAMIEDFARKLDLVAPASEA